MKGNYTSVTVIGIVMSSTNSCMSHCLIHVVNNTKWIFNLYCHAVFIHILTRLHIFTWFTFIWYNNTPTAETLAKCISLHIAPFSHRTWITTRLVLPVQWTHVGYIHEICSLDFLKTATWAKDSSFYELVAHWSCSWPSRVQHFNPHKSCYLLILVYWAPIFQIGEIPLWQLW